MFALSHIYVSTQVTGRKNKLLVFGSILPDISWSSKSEIGRDKIHYAPREFYNFVNSNFPEFKELALGVKLHSNIDKGADYYSDDEKIGFAKVEGKKIEKNVAELLGIEIGRETLQLSHSFIEASVDINLKEHSPYILDIYKNAMNEINLKEINVCLTEYLKLPEKVVFKELINFVNYLNPKNFISEKTLMKNIALPVIQARYNKEVDQEKVFKIFKKAKSITKNNFLNFLDNAVAQIKIDFADII
jgi:hypothetical protein